MDFHVLGGQETNNKTKKWNEIGQNLVSGALDRTKQIRKPAADIFANFGPEKTRKKTGESKIFSRCFRDFPVDLAQIPLNPRTNGWAPRVGAAPRPGPEAGRVARASGWFSAPGI